MYIFYISIYSFHFTHKYLEQLITVLKIHLYFDIETKQLKKVANKAVSK